MTDNTINDEQIAAGAAVLCDDGKPVGRNTAIMVWDAMIGAATSGDDPADDQWMFDLAAEYESRGNGLYSPVTFTAQQLPKFVQAVVAHIERAAAPAPDWFNYDESRDTLTIHGIKYSGELMRDFGRHMPQGQLFELVERQGDGALCVKRIEPATASGDDLPPLPDFFALGKTRINGVEHGHYSASQMQAYARAAGSAATKPTADAEDLAFNATRLRNVARLVGLEKSIPEDDATLDGARGSVLGLIAGTLRNAATKLPSERDMAIAQAVRQACCNCYSPDDSADDWSDKMGDIDLSSIIARFPHAATKPTADLSGLKPSAPLVYAPVQAAAYRHGFKDAIRNVQSLLAIKPAAAPAVPEELRKALQTVARWELPPTGKTWDDGSPMSYAACYGSNGERDYMRQIALNALATAPAASTPAAPAAWMRNNRKECTTAESKKQMENAGFGHWGEIAKSYTIPLYEHVASTTGAAQTAEQVRDAALEEAALAAEKVQDDYSERQGGKWPELRDDAATGAGDCATAIRALKRAADA